MSDRDDYDSDSRPSTGTRMTAGRFVQNEAVDEDTDVEQSEVEEEEPENEQDRKFINDQDLSDDEKSRSYIRQIEKRERRKERAVAEKEAKRWGDDDEASDDMEVSHRKESYIFVDDDRGLETSFRDWRFGCEPTEDSGKKLFLVATKPGKEYQVIIDLTKKYFSGEATAQLFTTVYSAFCPSPNCGYIYVEALTDSEVVRFRNGVQNFLFSRDPRIVPVDEMTQAMTVNPQTSKLRPGQFVRIRRERPNTDSYKGDLAQVVVSNLNRNRTLVKIVPRIDYDQLRDFVTGNHEMKDVKQSLLTKAKKDNKSYRPPQHDFDPELIKQVGGDVETLKQFKGFLKNIPDAPRQFSVWDETAFYKTFAYKDYPMTYLEANDVNPTAEEAKRFIDGLEETKFERGIAGFTENMRASLAGAIFKFNPGDKARAKREFAGMRVEIKEVTDHGTCHVRPLDDEDAKDLDIEIENIYLEKFFEEGERVQIVAGTHSGSLGRVIGIDLAAGTAQILLDAGAQTTEVSFGQLGSAKDRTGQQMTWDRYKVHDMIGLQDKSVGVIYSIEQNGTFHILLTTGQTRSNTIENISSTVRDQRVKDKMGHVIDVGRMVHLESRDERTTKTARVLHTFGNYVFVHLDSMENNGVRVIESRECKINSLQYEDTRSAQPSQGWRRGGPGFRRQGGGGANIGKKVVVLAGPYKGCIGDVKEVDQTSMRIVLHTDGRTVSLPLSEGQQAGKQARWAWADERKRDPFSSVFGKKKNQQRPQQQRMEPVDRQDFIRPDPNYGSMSPDSMYPPQGSYSPGYPAYGGSPMGGSIYSMDRSNR